MTKWLQAARASIPLHGSTDRTDKTDRTPKTPEKPGKCDRLGGVFSVLAITDKTDGTSKSCENQGIRADLALPNPTDKTDRTPKAGEKLGIGTASGEVPSVLSVCQLDRKSDFAASDNIVLHPAFAAAVAAAFADYDATDNPFDARAWE